MITTISTMRERMFQQIAIINNLIACHHNTIAMCGGIMDGPMHLELRRLVSQRGQIEERLEQK